MTRIIWNAEHGWHETEDDYRLTLTETGIRWANTTQEETDEDE